MRRIITLLTAGALFVGLISAPAVADDDATPTIAEIVIAVSGEEGPDNNPRDYDILLAAVKADPVLFGAVTDPAANLTVFAPNDRAFMRTTGTDSEAAAVDVLIELGLAPGSTALRDVVLYHVLGEEKSAYSVFFKRFWKTKKFEMVNGDVLKARWFRLIDGTDNRVRPVWRAVDIKASNGVIHTIREVLLPPA
jgi:uncharacterized surface protein with fasciclin (FAS1) repeats